MNRLNRILLSLPIVLALLLTACGGAAPATDAPEPTKAPEAAAPTEASAEPVHLTFTGWGGPEEIEVFQGLVDSFNAANPDIVIEYTPNPEDYVTKLKTMIAGGTPPDIAYIPDGDFSFFVSSGTLVNIQSFVDQSSVIVPDNIWPSALGRYTWDAENYVIGAGDLYALPKDIGPTVMFYNKDMFAAAGLPLPDPSKPYTWDELVAVAQQLTVDANGKHPNEEGFDPTTVVTWGVGDIWYENAVYGNGGQVVSDDGKTFVADMPETVAAIQFESDLIHVHRVSPDNTQRASQSVGQLFETGKVGMTTNGRWAVTFYRDALAFDWDVMPNPVGPSGSVYAADAGCSFSGWSGSVGIGIIAGSNGEQYAEQAYRFIEYLAGPEGQTVLTESGFQIPNQKDIAATDSFLQPGQKPESSEVFLEAARCEWPGPWTRTPLFGQWFDDNWWNGVWPEVVNEGTATAADSIAARKDSFQAGLDEAWASIGN